MRLPPLRIRLFAKLEFSLRKVPEEEERELFYFAHSRIPAAV
jgi:hypothetical protein